MSFNQDQPRRNMRILLLFLAHTVLFQRPVANAQRSLYNRGFGGHPFDDYGYGNQRDYGAFAPFGNRASVGRQRPSSMYDSYGNLYGGVDDYYGYRCPEYQPATVSKWRDTDDERFAVRIGLPGVHSGNQRVWLGEDGTTVHVRAARSLSAQGGRRCLPRNARLSQDGRSEILEVGLPLPSVGVDASRTTIRNVRGGIEVIVPRLRPAKHTATAQTSVRDSTVPPLSIPQATRETHGTPNKRPLRRQNTPVRRAVQWWKLPPSDGVEVVDEDWPAEEKLADAAEGWMDNRGEFQAY